MSIITYETCLQKVNFLWCCEALLTTNNVVTQQLCFISFKKPILMLILFFGYFYSERNWTIGNAFGMCSYLYSYKHYLDHISRILHCAVVKKNTDCLHWDEQKRDKLTSLLLHPFLIALLSTVFLLFFYFLFIFITVPCISKFNIMYWNCTTWNWNGLKGTFTIWFTQYV